MELSIAQYLILGIIQGITEWLPISSSGMITLVMANFFNIANMSEIIQIALFFHLGTFFAALIYFRKDVADLFVSLFRYRKSSNETKNILKFLIIATIITGIIGIIFMKLFINNLELTGKTITFAVGLLLLITGGIQLASRKKGLRKETDLTSCDTFLAGVAQGFSVIPGISRSGITTSTLLLRKLDDTSALRLSFLMSLPVVFLGNIFLNLPNFATVFTYPSLVGLVASFIFGILTIHILIKISKKINFAWFAIIFAVLMLISVLI